MNTCGMCHQPTRNRAKNQRGEVECSDCRQAAAYYASLTPQQLRAEHQMAARYVQESDGL